MDKINTSLGKIFISKSTQDILPKLSPGQVITGKIDKVFSTNKYLINIKNNLLVADSSFRFEANQNVVLQVKKLHPQIELKLLNLAISEKEVAENKELLSLLSNKNIPITNKNIELTKMFNKYRIEITPDIIDFVEESVLNIFSKFKEQFSRTEMLEILAFLINKGSKLNKKNVLATKWLLFGNKFIGTKLQVLHQKQELKEILQHFIFNFQDKEDLKDFILKLGYFYENKLKSKQIASLKNDLKYLLLQNKSRIGDLVLEDIKNQQLLSMLGNEFFIQIPFFDNENVNSFELSINKNEEERQISIRVNLSKLGEMLINIVEIDKRLSISVNGFKKGLDIFQKYFDDLSKQLKALDFTIKEIQFNENLIKKIPKLRSKSIDYSV